MTGNQATYECLEFLQNVTTKSMKMKVITNNMQALKVNLRNSLAQVVRSTIPQLKSFINTCEKDRWNQGFHLYP